MHLLDIQGTTVPALGLGTWELEGDACRTSLLNALELGYRHIDTAQAYGNEHIIGEALVASEVDRSDVFLATKVWNDNLTPDHIRSSTFESLSKLRTDYVDLLMIHWPVELDRLAANVAALTDLQESGAARHLGVCNFTASQLEQALELAPFFSIQVEHHPYLAQPSLLDMALEHDLMFTSYSPLGRGGVLKDPVIERIAAEREATPAQVVLRWHLDKDHVAAIPKATSRDHAESNLAALDVWLSEEDRKAIDALDRNERQVDPPWAPEWER